MKLNFYKYQGAGNDFIMLDERNQSNSLSTDQIAGLCHRNYGIGADGLIVLQLDNMSDFKMTYYNSDGNESSMCGNGGRCIVAFAHDLGMIKRKTSFNAIDGLHQAEIRDKSVHLQMKDVPSIERYDEDFIIDTGSPHYISFVNEVDAVDLIHQAREKRYSEKFKKEGINVNFVQVLSKDELKVRTYERGVEGETLACGTGVTASALAFAHLNKLKEFNIKIQAKGGNLEVSGNAKDEGFENIWLKGPAVKTFEGIIEI